MLLSTMGANVFVAALCNRYIKMDNKKNAGPAEGVK